MGRRSANHFPQIISGHNGIRVGATHTGWRFFCYFARSHVTNPATDPRFTEFALVLLSLHTAKTGCHMIDRRFFQKFQ
jgi:hypothetical protein